MANSSITLGYGGGAIIDNAKVLITSGNLSRNLSVPYIRPFSAPFDASKRMQLKIGDGVYSYSGSISFDMTVEAVDKLITSTFLSRNYEYEINIYDGEVYYRIGHCKTESFSISSANNSLVTAILNFQTIEDFIENSKQLGQPSYIFDDNLQLIKYWNVGGKGIESFTFTITHSLTPMYLNYCSGTDINRTKPQYLRVGLSDISFDITVYVDNDKQLSNYEYLEFAIGQKKIRILSSASHVFETEGFNYGGQNEYGSHTYTLRALAKNRSDNQVFEIISN